MKNLIKSFVIVVTIMCSLSNSNAQNQGPTLDEKLKVPEKIVKQYIKKRSSIWIDGQWKIKNNHYVWESGHWEAKKVGYVFVNGTWTKDSKGWVWTDGYWKQIPIKKWKLLYA